MSRFNPDPPIVKILKRRQVTDSGCWIWPGGRTPQGYGMVNVGGRNDYTHRVAYRTFKGPIPEGLQIDHLCRVTSCFNPAHLEAVTKSVNVLRAVPFRGPRRPPRPKTHCTHGHEFTEANTYFGLSTIGRPRRWCRACAARRAREQHQKARVAA